MNTSRIMGSVRRVVIDANVLIYLAVANLLLDLARREGLFRPCWSQQVLDETFRTVAVKFGRGVQHAATRLAEITVRSSPTLNPLLPSAPTTQKTATF